MRNSGYALKTMRLLVVAIVWTMMGCQKTVTVNGAEQSKQPLGDEKSRYDDTRLSQEQRDAVRAATQAVLDLNASTPDFARTFRYDVSQNKDGWLVFVWRINGFVHGSPQYAPDGYTVVLLDHQFKVTQVLPGG